MRTMRCRAANSTSRLARAMANKTIGISDELAAHVVEVDSRTPRMRTRTPIHALNTEGTGHERITLCLLPVADGVTLARRR